MGHGLKEIWNVGITVSRARAGGVEEFAQAAQSGLLPRSEKIWEEREIIWPPSVGITKSLLGLRLEIQSLVSKMK